MGRCTTLGMRILAQGHATEEIQGRGYVRQGGGRRGRARHRMRARVLGKGGHAREGRARPCGLDVEDVKVNGKKLRHTLRQFGNTAMKE